MKPKFFSTAIITAVLTLMTGCQSNSNSDNESENKCQISDSAEKHTAIPHINPNAKMRARYDMSGFCDAKNLEIWFDKIYFKDTTNIICLSSDYKNGDPIDDYVKVWSDGTLTVFAYEVKNHRKDNYYGAQSILLVYEGDQWKKKYLLNFRIEHLNDIDEDGIVEVANDMINYPQPIYVDEDERFYYYENDGRVDVYKCTRNSLLLDEALTKEVTDFVYAPTFIDTTIHVGGCRDHITGERRGGWDTTVTLVEYRWYLDLNKKSLYELGLRKRK